MFRATILFAAATLLVASGCASFKSRSGDRANLNDPRMKCVEFELFSKGYKVDASFRRPGRWTATRQFTGGNYYRAAISAAIDPESNTLDLWTRYIRPDESTVETSPPGGSLMQDALEVENKCFYAK